MDQTSIIIIAATLAASSAAVKGLVDLVHSWVAKKAIKSLILIQHPDGSKSSIEVDPTKEESIRKFIAAVAKSPPEAKIDID